MVKQTTGFDDAVKLFEMYCRAKGLAERTQQTYLYALDRLRGHLGRSEPEVAPPTRRDLRAFVDAMLRDGLARSTIRIRMRSIRVFCGFLVREGIVDESPMHGVEIPRVSVVHPEVLSASETLRLLRAAKTSSWHGVRNYAMLATFCDTGLRLGEVIGLNVSDIDINGASIRVSKGKGGKERTVYMGRTLSRALRKWLVVYPFSMEGQALFCTRDGRRLDQRNVARIIERTAARAGLGNRRVHPHLLRHTAATHFIKNGGDPFSLKRLLGHSQLSTTMIYVNLAGKDLAEAQAKASPVDRLSR